MLDAGLVIKQGRIERETLYLKQILRVNCLHAFFGGILAATVRVSAARSLAKNSLPRVMGFVIKKSVHFARFSREKRSRPGLEAIIAPMTAA